MALPGLTQEEHQRLVLSLGTHRRDRALMPLEVSDLLVRARAAGASVAQLAAAVGIASSDIIRKFLALSSLADPIKPLVAWGGSKGLIAFANAAEIASLPAPQQVVAAEAIVEHRLSNAEVEELMQVWRRSGQPEIEEVIEKTLLRRPQIDRRYVYMGELTEPAASRLGVLSVAARDALLQQAAVEAFGPIAGLAVSASGRRVALIAPHDLSDQIGADFDRAMSAALEAAS
jgi:hypothetical protein